MKKILTLMFLILPIVLIGQLTENDTIIALGKDDPTSDNMQEWSVKINRNIDNTYNNGLRVDTLYEGLVYPSMTVEEIQTVIDNYNYVIIGQSLLDTFLLDKRLDIASNKTIEIRGYHKIADAVIRPLAQDVSIGDTIVIVTDADTYYRSGQSIIISDTLQPIEGGGAGHTRRFGYASDVDYVSNDTVYLVDTVGINVSVAAVGQIGTFTSNYGVADAVNVTFKGTGIIDNNKENAYDLIAWAESQREPLAGCCISIENSSDINIEDLTLKNSVLHNISTWSVDYVKAYNVQLMYAHDKNWQFYDCSYFQIVNSRADSSDYEDGFMLYYGNNYFEFSNCQAFGNGRRGFGINSTNQYIDINNCTGDGNANNLYIGESESIHITNFNSIGGGIKRHNRDIPTSPVNILNSRDITISGITLDGCNDSVNDMFLIAGNSYNINISDSYIKNSANIVTGSGRGFSCDDAGSIYPHDVHLNNVLFDTLKTAFAFDLSGPEEIIFDKCVFTRNAALGTYRTFTKFYDCNGFATDDSGYITFTSAQTLRYGSIDIAAYPDQEKFKFWFLDDAGNTTKVWCDWTSGTAYPGNNFRVNLDIAPGKDINIAWEYDHNLNTAP